jgi:hypothetical protein
LSIAVEDKPDMNGILIDFSQLVISRFEIKIDTLLNHS